MDTFWNDLRYALRGLHRHPGFSAAALLVLTLATGSTTAVFSVVNAVLLRPLPYADPSQLVAITSTRLRNGTSQTFQTVSLDEVEQWRVQARSFDGIGSFVFSALPVRVGSRAMFLVAIAADPELLTTLGIRPAMGRNLPGSGGQVKDPAVLITHRLWVDAFDSDPQIIGRPLVLDGNPAVVAGVLPQSFQVPRSDASFDAEEPDIVYPVANIAAIWGRGSMQWIAIGRLKAGVSREAAEAELKTLTSHIVDRVPEMRGVSVSLAPLAEQTTRSVRDALVLTLGLFVVLLAIACTNTMSVLFSRASERQRELALRMAVGATSWRLVRQMITESACLTFMAGAAGAFVASIVADGLVAVSPAHLPVSGRVTVDWTVLGFTGVVCACAALLAGALPAIHASRQGSLLVPGPRSSAPRGVLAFQRGLMVAQIALGVGLLATAGVLVHSLYRLSIVTPGFRTDGNVTFEVAFPSGRPEEAPTHYQRILDAVRGTPGVLSAGWITNPPPETRSGVFTRCSAVRAVSPARDACNYQVTSEDYFSTAGVGLIRGRDFTTADRADAPEVAIVNETFARQYFPHVDPVGERVRSSFTGDTEIEIVGVVRDTRDRGLDARTVATIYRPYRQFALAYGGLVARLSAPPESVMPDMRRRLAKADPNVPIRGFSTIDARLRRTLDAPRFYTMFATAGGGMAVLFIALGLFGLVSYSVSRRTPEIGIRMALGAAPGDVLYGVVRDGLRMAAVGVLIGAGLAQAGTRLVASLLFETQPNDPSTLAAAITLVLLVTVAASWLPARRAARIDPLSALRSE